jgi:hypothetical protein
VTRTVLTTIGLAAALALATASAAALDAAGGDVGAATASVATCDPDGFSVSFTTLSGNVTSISIGSIAGACAGGQLSVTLTSSGVSVGSGGPVLVAGSAVDVAIPAAPDADTIDGYHATVVGP